MVKQSPFQTDLFDFKYIEDQVAAIKKSMKENETKFVENEKSLHNILDEQFAVLQEIQYLLSEIEKNTKKKKNWFNLKG